MQDHLRNIHTEFVFTLFNSFSEKDKTKRRTDNGNQVKVMKIAHNGCLVISANQKDHIIDSTIYVVLVKGKQLLLV